MSKWEQRPSGAWVGIVAHAADIVTLYDSKVTLRQLFYRLVADGTLKNTWSEYSALSAQTAKARRADAFPALLDRSRLVHRVQTYNGPNEALEDLRSSYRRDRTEGQDYAVYIAAEKSGLVEQLTDWFWDRGLPVLALSGFGSQTYLDDIEEDVQYDGRKAVLLYGGDYDASGLDIERDLRKRTPACDWFHIERVALTLEQIDEYDLPIKPGKDKDPRAAGFVRKHGSNFQVELDALPPPTLRELYETALEPWFADNKMEAVLAQEAEDRAELE
jgi:hypothetical protein